MGDDRVPEYVWKHATSLAAFLHEELANRDQEASTYFAMELYRAGSPLLVGSTPIHEAGVREPLAITSGDSIPLMVNTNGVRDEQPASDDDESLARHSKVPRRRQTIHLDRPLGDEEKRTLTHALFTGEPPVNLSALASRAFPNIWNNKENKRMPSMARSRAAMSLRRGIVRLANLLAHGASYSSDTAYLAEVKEQYSDLIRDEQTFIGYARRLCGSINVSIDDAFGRIKVETASTPSRSARSVAPQEEELEWGTTTWLQLLYQAIFHPDGPTVDTAIIAQRTDVAEASVGAMLNGALGELKKFWSNAEDANTDTTEFIAMIKDQWPGKDLEEILADLDNQ